MNQNTLFKCAIHVALTLLLVALPMLVPCVHHTLDNDIMQLFASGLYGGIPNEYTVYTHVLHGKILKGMYTLIPAVQWYTVYELAANVLCANVFLYALFNAGFPRVAKFLVFCLLCGMCGRLAFQPDFTLVAAELGLASVVTCLGRMRAKTVMLAYGLFLMGFILRASAVMLPFCICTPVLLFPYHWRGIECRKILVLGFFLVSAIALSAYQRYYYNQDGGWAYYAYYNGMRGQINDNPSADECEGLYEEGSKREEFHLLQMWEADGTILTADDLKQSVAYLKTRSLDNVGKSFWGYYYTYAYTLRYLLGFLLLAVVVVWRDKGKWAKLFCLSGLVLMFLLANAYVMSVSRPKESVLIPISVSFILSCCVVMASSLKGKMQHCLLLFLLGGTLYINARTWGDAVRWNQEALKQAEDCAYLCREIEYPKVAIHNGVPCCMNALLLNDSAIGKKLVRIGWSVNSPHTKRFYDGLMSYVDRLPLMFNKKNEPCIFLIEKMLRDYYQVSVTRQVLAERGDLQVIMFRRN